MTACRCKEGEALRFIVLTGGPGAGKTAVIELARRYFCKNLFIVPEAASIVFNGGFPRKTSPHAKKAAQRVIVKVQQELERLISEERPRCNFVLCDRGTLDGLAYWPDDEASFYLETGLSKQAEFARYHAVIHMHSPADTNGYNQKNPARTESAAEATAIDERIYKVWHQHQNFFEVPSTKNFFEKASQALDLISGLLSEQPKSTDNVLETNLERSRA